MKIHTSYFGKSRKLKAEHPDWVQIAVCGKMVFPWKGLRYSRLAPKVGFFTEWKRNGDNAFYIRHYNDEVLKPLDRESVLAELAELAGGEDRTVVLMCYEKPEDFCHRHLAAKWLLQSERDDNPKQKDGSIEFNATCDTCRHCVFCRGKGMVGCLFKTIVCCSPNKRDMVFGDCEQWEHRLSYIEEKS